MNPDLLGKCGFYCEGCPSYLKSHCSGCLYEHDSGDCFTRDCVIMKGIRLCGECPEFPCDAILTLPRSTVMDKAWLEWKSTNVRIDQ